MKKTIEDLEKELDPLIIKRDKLHDKIIKINRQIQDLREDADRSLDPDDIKALLECEPETQRRYKLFSKWCERYDLYAYGYYVDTNQRSVNVAFYDSVDLNKIKAGLSILMSHTKPLKDGYKHIHLMDPDCGEHGTYSIYVNDIETKIVKHYYHTPSDVKSFKTLNDCLDWASEHFKMEM